MAITDYFDRGRMLNPKGTAYVMDGQRWSFDEAYGITCQVANALVSLGLPKETKGAVLSTNHPLSWMCVLGIWRAGLSWVPLNPRSPLADHQHLVEGFDVEILFFQQYFAPVVQQLQDLCKHKLRLICTDGFVEGCESLPKWIGEFPRTPPDVLVEPDQLAAIMPTGGTTGLPKGVMVTHRNVGVSIANSIINTAYNSNEPIVNLAAAPMTHTAGYLSIPATARGGTVVVVTKPDPVGLLDVIEEHGVTEFFLPPTVIYRLLELPGIRERKLPSLKYFMYGAAPMSVEKLKQAMSIFGPVMFQGYGQTEAPGGISGMRPEDHYGKDGQPASDDRLSACGRPSVLNATAIMDEQGRQLAMGETGEICVRGDIVMKGYYKQPDKTAETIINGWLHTGDVGHIDGDGFLHITDRKKDVIISGGFNVYPSETEQVIWTHPAVLDCAVIGVPDDNWGEAVKAVVELKAGAQATADEIIALCKERLGSVKAPKTVDFIPSLPRSPAGKVLKKELREPYWAKVTRRV
jgi:acyl-CoA synthetase (AMP-forming)/AMP-acid ligase II